jgi:hypothetical protein
MMSTSTYTGHLGAVVATVSLAFDFHAVANHTAIAVVALRGQRVNRTFETIENMLAVFTGNNDLERLRILIPANFTTCHGSNSHFDEENRTSPCLLPQFLFHDTLRRQ